MSNRNALAQAGRTEQNNTMPDEELWPTWEYFDLQSDHWPGWSLWPPELTEKEEPGHKKHIVWLGERRCGQGQCAIRILVGEKHIGIDVTKWDERRELAGFLEEMAEKLRGG